MGPPLETEAPRPTSHAFGSCPYRPYKRVQQARCAVVIPFIFSQGELYSKAKQTLNPRRCFSEACNASRTRHGLLRKSIDIT